MSFCSVKNVFFFCWRQKKDYYCIINSVYTTVSLYLYNRQSRYYNQFDYTHDNRTGVYNAIYA